mgnify:FL=1
MAREKIRLFCAKCGLPILREDSCHCPKCNYLFCDKCFGENSCIDCEGELGVALRTAYTTGTGMKIKYLFTIWLFSYIHGKGWCKSWHRSEYIQKTSGSGECHLIDQIMLILHPTFVSNTKSPTLNK